MPSLVLGTFNRKKALELVDLVAPFGVTIESLAEHPTAIHVVEDGNSFAANAALKATQQALRLNRWVLAEDSGICVDALGGAPGIYSARYSGETATDESNNVKLLAELAETPAANRSAHYVCHVTLSDPSGAVRAESEAICRGRIRREAVGASGFGYDPLFEVVEYHRTFAELGENVKGTISHRARAIRLFLPQLRALLKAGDWPASR
jgi:XTP/dITP diphosphohydrolase